MQAPVSSMDYELSLDRGRMQVDVIHTYLASSYWSPGIRRDIVERAIQGSLVCGAFDRASGAQVGFARVVTDRATFAWLCDVFVLDAHRGKGLAKRMLQEVLEHPEIVTLRRWCLATRDAHSLYSQFGFQGVPADRWMELKLPPSMWQQEASAT